MRIKQRLARIGARAGLLAGATVAVLALSGIGAGSALASPLCPEDGQTILGRGSSLQKIAQQNVWSPTYNTACEATANSVMYESTGSGPGLAAWGFTAMNGINTGFAFIGTDDAPTKAQIVTALEQAPGNAGLSAAEIEMAIETHEQLNTNALVIPVAQTAIAVPIHLPAGCMFTAGTGITSTDLTRIWSGVYTNWNEVANTTGTCGSHIKRVVRAEGSGTTYQFKNYLAEIVADGQGHNPLCTASWVNLRAIGAEEKPNITWPEGATESEEEGEECGQGTPVIRKAGGGEVATEVQMTEGTIGYAALPDVKAKGATPALIQNGVEEEEEVVVGLTYASPEAAEEKANCAATSYNVPQTAQTGEIGTNADWSAVFGANPTIGGTAYPLCTLTYILAWDNYTGAGFGESSHTVTNTTKDYVYDYILEGGQNDINGNWYSKLPAAGGNAHNALDAARFAAEMM